VEKGTTASVTTAEQVTDLHVPFQGSGPWITQTAFDGINELLATIDENLLESSSYSLEVTSGDETLWTNYHTSQQRNKERPGVACVDGNSQYRIASVTKAFTALGLLHQHAAGNISLDDSVDKYITELRDDESVIQWNGITLRSLASQLYVYHGDRGIPRSVQRAIAFLVLFS